MPKSLSRAVKHPVPPPPRRGRPSQAEAAKVEARLLDAATQVFLERGFDAATFDQIAEAAQAGKATLYARYAGKEALFTAVIRRNIDVHMQLASKMQPDAPDRLRQRLEIVLRQALSTDVVSLIRVVIAAAPRFPALARQVHAYGTSHMAGFLAQVMADDPQPTPGSSNPGAVDTETALLLVDMAFAPLMMEALLGTDVAQLRAEVTPQVARVLTVLRRAGLLG